MTSFPSSCRLRCCAISREENIIPFLSMLPYLSITVRQSRTRPLLTRSPLPVSCYMINAAKTYSFDATVIGNGDAGIIADAGFHATSAGIDPKSAKLMWEDSEGFISGVSLVKGKVNFTAEKNVGNAMIAVFDGAGTVLWS